MCQCQCDHTDKLHKEAHCPKLARQQIQTKYPRARHIQKHASSEHDIMRSHPDHTNSESWQSEIIRTNSFDIFCLGVFYCDSGVADSQSAEYSSSDAKTRQDRDNNAVTVTTPIIVKTYSSLLLQSLSERRIESFNLLFTPQQSLMNEWKIRFSDWLKLLLGWLSESICHLLKVKSLHMYHALRYVRLNVIYFSSFH